jgi:hypothetical protein
MLLVALVGGVALVFVLDGQSRSLVRVEEAEAKASSMAKSIQALANAKTALEKEAHDARTKLDRLAADLRARDNRIQSLDDVLQEKDRKTKRQMEKLKAELKESRKKVAVLTRELKEARHAAEKEVKSPRPKRPRPWTRAADRHVGLRDISKSNGARYVVLVPSLGKKQPRLKLLGPQPKHLAVASDPQGDPRQGGQRVPTQGKSSVLCELKVIEDQIKLSRVVSDPTKEQEGAIQETISRLANCVLKLTWPDGKQEYVALRENRLFDQKPVRSKGRERFTLKWPDPPGPPRGKVYFLDAKVTIGGKTAMWNEKADQEFGKEITLKTRRISVSVALKEQTSGHLVLEVRADPIKEAPTESRKQEQANPAEDLAPRLDSAVICTVVEGVRVDVARVEPKKQ